ncbi:MAG: PTS sugar transporter subunit IIA [Candidatus Riflebacteria bacterium]|nr:PTS sugar transporter subunit IIA [Candidatus Riflebacteria bacterium]
MIGIVVVSHGLLSEQLVAAASLILGEAKAVKAVTFMARESLEDLRRKTTEATNEFVDDGCIIFTDIMGGSATNVSIEIMKSRNDVFVVTGVNLPMLIDAINSRESLSLKELAAQVSNSGVRSIINLKEFFEKRAAKRV